MQSLPKIRVVLLSTVTESHQELLKRHPTAVWGCPCGESYCTQRAASSCRKCWKYLEEVPNEVQLVVRDVHGAETALKETKKLHGAAKKLAKDWSKKNGPRSIWDHSPEVEIAEALWKKANRLRDAVCRARGVVAAAKAEELEK